MPYLCIAHCEACRISRLAIYGQSGVYAVQRVGLSFSAAWKAKRRVCLYLLLLSLTRPAQVDDRFDPYKRPRGSSPGLLNGSSPFPMSPSRGSISIPVPQSPSLAPMFSSHRPVKGAHHPYSRPMSSRSRAASPALSIGSTSGVLSTSLGRDGISSSGPSRGFSLAAAFCGPGVNAAVNAANSQGAAPQALGSLGLLSLANGGMQTDRDEGVEMIREDSEEGRSAMEED